MYEEMRGRAVLVTGATGLIGKAVVRRLLSLGARVIAVVRNIEKANALFGKSDQLEYIVTDITNIEVKALAVDYVIHAASNTSSSAFVHDPVGVANTAIEGTRRTLEIARISGVRGYAYLSSMEVYGTPATDEKIDERHSTNLNTMAARSAYPESKRMCESLCASYASEYGVPARVIRLTQTFGPGVLYEDGRVFAEFARCAIEGRDIVLHTKGETKRSYLYTEDAVNAILTVLLTGETGEVYNAANEDTYCSIREMAELVAEECSDKSIKVRIEENDISKYGYAPTLHMNLDTGKLRKLGWEPETDLRDMFCRMIQDMKGHKSERDSGITIG